MAMLATAAASSELSPMRWKDVDTATGASTLRTSTDRWSMPPILSLPIELAKRWYSCGGTHGARRTRPGPATHDGRMPAMRRIATLALGELITTACVQLYA
jgi:hypothetical protein